jgi:hypothetical protein
MYQEGLLHRLQGSRIDGPTRVLGGDALTERNEPQDEPDLQTPSIREVHWALELAAGHQVSRVQADRIWQQVKGMASEGAESAAGGALRRLREGLLQGWRQISASLVQEILVPSAAVRGAESAEPALLIYETDRFAISLSFSRPNETSRLRLVGQLAPKSATEIPAGGRIIVWGNQESATSELDERGEFALDPVPGGDLHMDILLGKDAIQLSPIQTRSGGTREE